MRRAQTPANLERGRLELAGVSARIGRTTVLDGLDLMIGAGQRWGVVGVNGSGKSTLLRIAAGLRAPTTGVVRLGGVDLSGLRARDRAQRIALVSQESVPPSDLRVGELVALGRTPHRSAWAYLERGEEPVIRSALAAVGMEDAYDLPCGHLSGGERRRVVLARGIAQETDVLLLDEPTNHLDVRHQLELLEVVGSLERTVVAAVHDLDLALRWFDQVVVLHEHRVHACGPPEQVLTAELIAAVFGVRGTRLTHPGTDRDHLVLEGLV